LGPKALALRWECRLPDIGASVSLALDERWRWEYSVEQNSAPRSWRPGRWEALAKRMHQPQAEIFLTKRGHRLH